MLQYKPFMAPLHCRSSPPRMDILCPHFRSVLPMVSNTAFGHNKYTSDTIQCDRDHPTHRHGCDPQHSCMPTCRPGKSSHMQIRVCGCHQRSLGPQGITSFHNNRTGSWNLTTQFRGCPFSWSMPDGGHPNTTTRMPYASESPSIST